MNITDFKIRSFVKRGGRLTESQRFALTELLPKYTALDCPQPIDFNSLFDNQNPVQLEIGFGNGAALIDMAQQQASTNFIGIEVHDPGVGHAVKQADKLQLQNIRIAHTDAMEFVKSAIPSHSIEKIMLFFPDPWHKKKHHKRRIVRPEFMEQIVRMLAPQGIFHMATDWQDYAEQALEQINQVAGLKNISENNDYVPRPESRTLTKFEQRGHRLGHGVWDMMWQKTE